MKTFSDSKPIVVFTGTSWQAGLLKSLLENAEIEAFLYNAASGTFNPGWNMPGEGGSVRVVVDEGDLEKATAVVKDFLSTTTDP